MGKPDGGILLQPKRRLLQGGLVRVSSTEGCAAKANVCCGKVLLPLDPGAPCPGSSVGGGANWRDLRCCKVLVVKTALGDSVEVIS